MLSSYLRRRAVGPSALIALLGALVLALVLAGCGSNDSTATPTPSTSPGTSSGTPPTTSTSRPTVTGAPRPTYVALGDSYTAAPFVPVTDPNVGCLRSTGNYPSLIAKQLPSFQLEDVSCSGASSTSMIGVQVIGNQANEPQFDALTDSTALVTLGLGGNDYTLFSTLIKTCTDTGASLLPDPCTAAFNTAGGDVLRAKLADTLDRLTAVIEGIRNRAPHAKIVVVDYPQLIPATGHCSALPMKPGDYEYARGINRALSATVRLATRRAHVGAVAINLWKASAGHDICAKVPWVNGAETDPARALSYHPFAIEQQAVAALVLAKIKTG